jgi:hypothetical protein
MIVVGRDGFIDWAWSSKPLLKSGIFYRPRQEVIELPPESLASQAQDAISHESSVKHPAGVWKGDEDVTEMCIFTEEYSNMSISLLKYPKLAKPTYSIDEDAEEDVVDRFERRLRRE